MDLPTIGMDKMPPPAAAKNHQLRRDPAGIAKFFFGRTDLSSYGIQCLGLGRAGHSFRQRQHIKKRTLFHFVCVFVCRGEGFFESGQQARTAVKKNTGMLFLPGEWHSYGCKTKGPWQEYWIAFDGQAVRQAHHDGILSARTPLFFPSDPDRVKKLFESGFALLAAPTDEQQRALPGLFHSLLDAMIARPLPAVSSSVPKIIDVVRRSILDHPADDFDFPKMARENGISYSLLRQEFRKANGMPLASFRNQARMNLACKLLGEGHSVKETAFLVGFHDPYHFSRVFRQAYKVPPVKFSRRLQ
jgi:AraC-like DNA-binding protein